MRFLSSLIASTLGTLIAFGVIFVFMLLTFAAMFFTSDSTPRVAQNSVLVIPFSGGIPEVAADDPFAQLLGESPSFDLLDITSSLEKAAVDDRVSALWLQFQNLSASWATLYEVRDALERFKESGKPIYASSNDYMMAESDYYLASIADSVFAAPGAMFEYNGFFINSVFFKRLMDNLEIEPEIIRAGRFKAATEPFTREDMSPENEQQLAAILATQNDFFMQTVSQSRGMAVEELERLASDAAILTVEGAYDAGLLDQLAYEDEIEDIIRARIGVDADDDLRTISLRQYARVPESEAGIRRGSDGEIAIVYARGTIMSGSSDSSPFGGSDTIGSETFVKAMKSAREDDRVDAVVLRIDSPGGSASASEVMWREIELTSAEKPVVVSMGGLAASGGYWIASGGDAIVATPMTLTGSIGVFSMMFDASGFLEDRIGITFDAVRTSSYADLFSGVRPLAPEERDLMQGFTDEIYDKFLKRVSNSRGMTTAEVDSIGQGRVWSGRDAQRLGLVDELGTLRDAIELAAERAGLEEDSYRTRILPRPKTLFEQIGESMSAQAMHAASYLTMTPEERRLRQELLPLARVLQDVNSVQARLLTDIEVR